MLRLVSSVRILDGTKVENLALNRGSSEEGEKCKSGKNSENTVQCSSKSERQRRKRGAAEAESSPVEDSTETFLVRKRKKSHSSAGMEEEEDSVEIKKKKKKKAASSPLEGTGNDSLSNAKKIEKCLVLTEPALVGGGEEQYIGTAAEYGGRSSTTSHQSPGVSHQSPGVSHQSPGVSHQSPGVSHQSPGVSHPGVKASLKTMSRGRSGVVAVEEVRQQRKKNKVWDAVDDDHLVGSGQPSTWK